MAALMQLFTESIRWRAKAESTTVRESKSAPYPRDEKPHRVGEYYADYSSLSPEQLAASDPEMDDLIRRSRVVSVKRGL